MNHLLAKTKGRNGDYYIVVSDNVFFELPEDLNNCSMQYNASYKLEEDEWFSISNFSTQSYCIDFINMDFLSTDYNQISIQDYSQIDYFVAYQEDVYFFQKMSSSQLMERKFLAISSQPQFIDNKKIIILKKYPDAIYYKNYDILYFKTISSINSIFRGIEILYREATQEETEEFLNNGFIRMKNGYSAVSVKSANRKRITMVRETLQRLKLTERKMIFEYIREYCTDIEFDETDENFIISNETDLKKLLYGIEQRYYTTKLGNERRLANSIITLQ